MTQAQWNSIVARCKTGEVVIVKHSRYVLCPVCHSEILAFHGESDKSDCHKCYSITWKQVQKLIDSGARGY